jgi:hypothetical protein
MILPKGLYFPAQKSKTPYIGGCTNSTDDTFVVGSLTGTTYDTGLAIGGTSGNLLWKTKIIPTINKVGTTIKPVYISENATAECLTYAGGTKVTLNGADCGASTASFYAPSGAGTSGQVLTSTGGAPAWTDQTSLTSIFQSLDSTAATNLTVKLGGTEKTITSLYATALSNTTAIGGSTSPVYFNASGKPTKGSTYAGGTKVTLNGTAKGASTASFYARTASGTAGQILQSAGSGTSPTWISATKGSTTKPVYLSAGVPTECSSYAGGTAVTLNGTSKAGSTASFYAPVNAAAGTGQVVAWSVGPAWVSQADIVTAANVKAALGTGKGTTKYLREDGTWVKPPDTNTHAVSSVNGKTGAVTLTAKDVGITLNGNSNLTTASFYAPTTAVPNTSLDHLMISRKGAAPTWVEASLSALGSYSVYNY